MSNNNYKPILLLDIDGVINIEPPVKENQVETLNIGTERIFFPKNIRENLAKLIPVFDIIWASAWEADAPIDLAPELGLPDFPHLVFPGENNPRFLGFHAWKLSVIDKLFNNDERALAWIDDDFDAECRTWGKERKAPTLLVPTDPYIGLSKTDALKMIMWAQQLA